VEAEPKADMAGLQWARINLAGVVILVLQLTGSSPIAVEGNMQVGEDCLSGSSDYPDIDQGAQVVITTSSGTVIATTALGAGHQAQELPGYGAFGDFCNYPFSVKVPGGQAQYGVTVSHRGTIWFTPQQMAKGPGLTLNPSS
jgi:hypothetical protein